ncbi:MAG: RNA-binding S4 domain-containing protein [Sphingobacteriales bacterium]|jgi:ribosome-associated heat shock protein Hsp15|nr:RNA-binding S4 domain-containing protein [Sphingobacteriales bacterium]
MNNMESAKLRLDKYLWSIRLFKTRSLAAEACDKGKVKLNGNSLKPARNVQIGEEYEIRTSEKKWLIKVLGLLHTRVQYSEAIKYYSDITPAEETDRIKFEAAFFQTGKRQSKVGRPTKKDKRDLDEFLDV